MGLYTFNEPCKKCGETFKQEFQVYGPVKDRDRKAEYMKKDLCLACWKDEQDASPARVEMSITGTAQKPCLTVAAYGSYAIRVKLSAADYTFTGDCWQKDYELAEPRTAGLKVFAVLDAMNAISKTGAELADSTIPTIKKVVKERERWEPELKAAFPGWNETEL